MVSSGSLTPEVGDPCFLQAESVRLQIGEKQYKYKFANPVAGLFRRGFKDSGLEYDITAVDGLIDRGRIRGIQPGVGILSDPDTIRSDVKQRMDVRYGVGNWEFVEIVDVNDNSHSIFKPLIKS